MTILITGAGGQLGSELAVRLGKRATAYDRDLLDVTSADPILLLQSGDSEETAAFEAVINGAAYTNVDKAECDAERCARVNADAVESMAAICAILDIPFVQISTDYVFGGDVGRTSPYTEDDVPAPINVYGKTKLAGERFAATCPKHLIVRTCGLYANAREFQRVKNFAQTMLRLGRERDVVRVVNDQICSPTFVPHLAAAVLFLLERESWGTYHVVDQGAVSWHEFAVELFRQAGMATRVEAITTEEYVDERQRNANKSMLSSTISRVFGNQETIAPRPRYSVLDTAKYARLGGPVMPTWREGIAAYLAAMET
jgi:dTDP-4-dehydrorhamnose reductase